MINALNWNVSSGMSSDFGIKEDQFEGILVHLENTYIS